MKSGDKRIRELLEPLKIEISAATALQLEDYARCLWSWNTKINLTRHTDYERYVYRDLLDSWQLAALIQDGEEVLDIGSGGGVPGIVLAILRPDLKITLCDSVGKKCHALDDMAKTLKLPLDVHHQRVEDLLEVSRFDACTSRAVGPLWKLCRWLDGCWLEAGRLLATKGPNWVNERAEAKEKGLLKKVNLKCVAEYETPSIQAKNFILKLWAKGAPEK